MSARFWLDALPSTDAVFAPLQRAGEFSLPGDWDRLSQAHKQAMSAAAWGASLAVLEERAEGLLLDALRLAERDDDGSDAASIHNAEVEALGYALGVTAVRVAIRRRQQDTGTAVAA